MPVHLAHWARLRRGAPVRAHAEIDFGYIIVEVSPREKDNMRGIPGSTYKDNHWQLPLTLASCWALRSIFGPELSIGPGLQGWATERVEKTNEILAFRNGEKVYALGEHLYPFQQIGASWMRAVGRAILGDEQGLGKTIEAIAAVGGFPILIVATNSMLYKWATEAEKWLPNVSVSVVTGTAAQRRKAIEAGADITIIAWANLYRHSRLAPYGSVALSDKEKEDGDLNRIGYQTIIADEVHRAINPKAKQTRAWWHLSHAARYSYGLTGTLIANNAGDLWAPMHGIAPDEWPAKTKYIDRYTVSALNAHGGLEVFGFNPSTKDELFRILTPRFLRRTKAEVLTQLPDIAPVQIREMKMEAKQAKGYEQMKKHLMTVTDEGDIIAAATPLVRDGRLEQAAAATLALDENGEVVLTMPSVKVDTLMDLLDEVPGEPLVVFGKSKKLMYLCGKALEKAKISFDYITGDQSDFERAESVGKFQAGNLQVLLCTLGAGSEGITLTRANRMLFLQRSWRHIDNMQAEARIHRIGQEREVQYIIAKTIDAPIEDRVLESNGDKKAMMDEVNEAGE